MPTTTLAEAAKLIQDDLNQVVAEDIITTNPFFRILNFTSFVGQAIIVPREDTLGDADFYSVGDTITHKNPPTTDEVIFRTTKIIGDVELDDKVRVESENRGMDRLGFEVRSKAKRIGRLFQAGMVTGNGVAPQMNSLPGLVDSSQFTPASAGQDLSFDLIDVLIDLVVSNDKVVDFIFMSGRDFRKYKSLMRSVSSVTPQWVMDQFGNRGVAEYEGIPIFQNDFLSTTETANGAALTGGALSSIYAGVIDDGTRSIGISAIYSEGTDMGINVEVIGKSHDKDEQIVRVKQYTNMASFNRRGLARLPSIQAS